MDQTLLLLPTAPLFKPERKNWPPPPKVIQFDVDGTPLPRGEDPPDIAELKRDRAIFLFDAMNTAQIAASLSVLELDKNASAVPTSPVKELKRISHGTLSTLSLVESVTKLLDAGSEYNGDGDAPSSIADRRIALKAAALKKRKDASPRPRRKAGLRQIPRMSRIVLTEYLRNWDKGSTSQRLGLIHKFLEDYSSQDPLDLDHYLSKAGSLIFIRFIVGMQISFQCKKSVASHFMALEIFIKSLEGERYTYEFGLAGGFQTSFEVLRVHELTNHDKMHAFHFLFAVVDGKGGGGAKRFLCNETSYLECVVDCLTMCQNEHVIKEAKQFLQSICLGNTSKNLEMISKYVISLLPCDFNPQIQAIACDLLEIIIKQVPDVATGCCALIVDVLKSNYDDSLVNVGDVCLAIMATPSADLLLLNLIGAAEPYNLVENLSAPGVISHTDPTGSDLDDYGSLHLGGPKEPEIIAGSEADPYFRLQYGAIYVLNYMVKNQIDMAYWMMDRGVIGCLLSGIGTACYNSVQMEAVRLLLLLNDISSDCSLALASLLPKKLLSSLLNDHEDVLQYVTAIMCLILRRLGSRVQANWDLWFSHVNAPEASGRRASSVWFKSDEGSGESNDGPKMDKGQDDIMDEIQALVELLDTAMKYPYATIVESIKLIMPEPSVFEQYRARPIPPSGVPSGSRQTFLKFQDKNTVGEEFIMETEELEAFRKYLRKNTILEHREDEFEKYYAAKFIMQSDTHTVDLDAMQVAALQDAEQALKRIKESLKTNPAESTAASVSQVVEGSVTFGKTGQDQTLNL